MSLSILLLHSQSVPSPPAHRQTNLNLGLGVTKQCREQPHFITLPLCIKCIKATVPSSLRGFPKCCCPLLELRSAERHRCQASCEVGKRQARDPVLQAGKGLQGEIHSGC